METASPIYLETPPKVEIAEEIYTQLSILDSQALTTSEKVRLLAITDQETYDAAVAWGRLIATFIAETEEKREKMTKPLYEPLGKIRAGFKAALDVAEQDKQFLSRLVGAYDAEQVRIQAERDRVARVEHERQQQEEKLKSAIQAEDAGLSIASVDRILSSPISTAAPMAPPSHQRASGKSDRKYWHAYPASDPDRPGEAYSEEDAFWTLIKAAAVDRSLMVYLERNVSACDKKADIEKMLFKLPGYEARAEAKASFRKV